MSLHALFSLRDRRVPLGLWVAACSVIILLLLAATPHKTFAQADPPPPPPANSRSATTLEDTAVSIDTGNEADLRYQVVVVVPGPTHGTIAQGGTFPGNFTINYTPGANQTVPVSFSYQICTVIGTPTQCGQSALVTVSIIPVNDGPQAGPDTAAVVYGQSVLIPVLNNDNGGANEVDSVSLVSVSTPGNGTAVIEGNQIRYNAPTGACPGAPLSVSFNYQARDGVGNQATGMVTVTVKCPGTPELKLSEPYAFSSHTFKIDVILNSPDVNVAAIDFFLKNDQCVTDPDVPTNNMIGSPDNDVTTTLVGLGFYFDVRDQLYPTALHFVAAAANNPSLILAGPSNPTRTIATVQFKATATCSPVNFTLTDAISGPPGFTGTGGTPISGIGTPMNVMLANINLNNKPTNIALSNNKVSENSLVNTFIGEFSTTDPDTGDTFTYIFAAPYFGNDQFNPKFRIRPQLFNNNELAVNTIGLPSGVYSITVGSTDSYGGLITKTFTIDVTDVNKAPIAVDDNDFNPAVGILVAGPADIYVLTNDTDPNDFPVEAGCPGCSVVSATNGSKGIVVNQGTKVRYIPTDPKFTGVDTFSYIMTDNDAPSALTAQAKVTVTVSAEQYTSGLLVGQPLKLGDCNKSGAVEAGDLTATGLEMFDTPAGSNWYDTPLGTYAFSAYGCNSNQDAVVDAGDIACTARKIFPPAFVCGGPVLASSAGIANLAVGNALQAAPGTTVQVPVMLSTAGHSVAAAAFALDFNGDELSFDATDADSDGMPDAVSLNIPSGLLATASYNAAESRVEIVMTGLTLPFPLLTDGAVATVSLTVKQDVAVSTTTVALTNSSLGSDEGQSVPVEVTDGSIEIVNQPTSRVLLPLILSR